MPVLKYWNGSAWADLTGGGPPVYVAPEAPAPRGELLLWVDTDEASGLYVAAAEMGGPWAPAYTTLTLPFKADVLVTWSASFWAVSVGNAACQLYVDTGFVSNWAMYFFNEAASHKEASSAIALRGLAKGAHTIGVGHALNATSDGNDRAHLSFTCVAVP